MEEFILNYCPDIDSETDNIYQIFINRTNDVALIMLEQYINGKSKTTLRDIYGDILEAREYAREKLNE